MPMLRGEFPDAGEQSPEEFDGLRHRAAETVETVGVEVLVAEAGLDQATVTAFADGDIADRTLDEAVVCWRRAEPAGRGRSQAC